MDGTLFAKRLVSLREWRRLTQAQLAEILGVARETVHRWESGKHGTAQKRMDDICRALGVTEEQFWNPDWLPGGIEGNDKAPPIKAGPYHETRTDERHMALNCPRCGSDDFEEDSLYCRQCAFPLYNICTHPNMDKRHVNPPKAVYCGKCALPTFWSLSEVTLEQIRGEQWPYKHRNDEEERGTS